VVSIRLAAQCPYVAVNSKVRPVGEPGRCFAHHKNTREYVH
jgi:hypothetical protein